MTRPKKSQPARGKWLTVEILSCASCGTLTVCLGNKDGGMRLSNHKCAGSWSRVSAFSVPVAALQADLSVAARLYGWRSEISR